MTILLMLFVFSIITYVVFLRPKQLRKIVDEPLWVLFIWVYIGFCFGVIYLVSHIFDGEALSNICINSISDYLDFFYFSYIALATVGFGEIHPVSSSAKIMAVIESAIGLITAMLLAVSGSNKVDRMISSFKLTSIHINNEGFEPTDEKRMVTIVVNVSTNGQLLESATLDIYADMWYRSDDPVGNKKIAALTHGASADGTLSFEFDAETWMQYTMFTTKDVWLQLTYSARSNIMAFKVVLDQNQKNSINGSPHSSSRINYSEKMYEVLF